MHTCAPVNACAGGGQKRTLNPLDLESQVVVSLGTELVTLQEQYVL